jgi:hypothetical protein
MVRQEDVDVGGAVEAGVVVVVGGAVDVGAERPRRGVDGGVLECAGVVPGTRLRRVW